MSDHRRSWQNWSGTARCRPVELARPVDEHDVVDVVARAVRRGRTVRAAGTGHSFNGLACTDGVLVDMSRCAGVLDVDPVRSTVTVLPGTTLSTISRALARHGMALPNVGTLADQTVGGAISTGNHGTGSAFGPLATHVERFRLVTADAGVRTVTADDEELMRCLRVALGALGVITSVTLRCVPRFSLHVVRTQEPLAAFLQRLPDWAHSADHVTVAWSPWSASVTTSAATRGTEDATAGAWRRPLLATAEELRCGLAGVAGNVSPGAVRWLSRSLPPWGGTRPWTGESHTAFAFAQPVRFVALEHALPLDSLADAVAELGSAFRESDVLTPYAVLGRVGAGDDAPLSPAYGRATAYLNVTVPRGHRYTQLHRLTESVLRGHGGRPHWGKAHTADAAALRPLYPEWDLFQRTRGKLDPAGVFTNRYLDHVLGAVDAAGWSGRDRSGG